MPKQRAGWLPYLLIKGMLEVLLVRQGGPYFGARILMT